ncbi:hypothetical protein ACFL6Y_06725, partial [Elusimicrobiota bacterium]
MKINVGKVALKSICITLIASLLITLPGAGCYEVLAKVATQSARHTSTAAQLPITPKAQEKLEEIYSALESLGFSKSIAPKSYFYDFIKDEVTDYGFILTANSKPANDIKKIWKDLKSYGVDNPFSIRLELIYDFEREKPTPFLQDIKNFYSVDSKKADDAVAAFHEAIVKYHQIPKNATSDEFYSHMGNLFDTLDFIKEKYPQMAITATWFEDRVAPGYRYNMGIVDETGTFKEGSTMTMPDGRTGYLEFERGIPVRLIVESKDKDTGLGELSIYSIGFDKKGELVPIGYADTRKIQLVEGGVYVEVPQTKTTAKELAEA